MSPTASVENTACRSNNGLLWIYVAGIVILYGGLFVYTHALSFPIRKDELHYWPTTLSFSQPFPPPVGLIRDYPEASTPLPFLVWGFLEHLLHGGIRAGRLMNLLLSAGILTLVGIPIGRKGGHSLLAAVGLLLFPYYLGVSIHLYTDLLAAGFALMGFLLHLRGRSLLGSVGFILSIACRQYMVAFPGALLVFEGMTMRRSGFRFHARWIAPLVAVSSLLFWVWIFGGMVPRASLTAREVPQIGFWVLIPQNGLYFLTGLGAYFVVPEFLFYRRWKAMRFAVGRRTLVLLVCVAALFVFFPPLNMQYGKIPTMGYLDKAVRLVLPDVPRMCLFGVLAFLAVLRFSRLDLEGWMVAANVAAVMKGHGAWEKYLLPLLVLLWYVRGIRRPEASSPGAERPQPESTGELPLPNRGFP